MKKWIPWIIAALTAGWFLSGAQAPKPKNGFDLAGFGRLPVLLNGRVQPMDSVARNSLLSISGKSIVRVKDATPLSATEWLLDTLTRPETADTRKIFRVQHPDLEGMFGAGTAELATYSYNDLTNSLNQLGEQVEKLRESEGNKEDAEKLRNPFQKDMMHLYNSIVIYQRLKNSLKPEGSSDFKEELQAYKESIVPGKLALENSQNSKDFNDEDVQRIAAFFRRYEELSQLAYPLIIP